MRAPAPRRDADGPAGRLRIDGDAIAIVVPDDGAPARTVRFDAAPARLAARWRAHAPPSALQIETAIEHVEEALMREPAGAAGVSVVAVDDPRVRALAAAAGTPRLDADAIERLFDRLAALAQGRPASQDTLPADPLAAATLVVLRELVHHQRIEAFVVD